MEAKYISDIEDVETFETRLNAAMKEVRRRVADPNWRADYGIIAIVAWSPEHILYNESCIPAKVGNYDNPYIEFFSEGKGGG